MAAHVSCVVGAAFIATWDIWRFPQQKWGLRGARAALFAENSQINAVPAAGTTRSEPPITRETQNECRRTGYVVVTVSGIGATAARDTVNWPDFRSQASSEVRPSARLRSV